MFDVMAERVANKWIEITNDPDVAVQKERDWDGFLGFLRGLMEILLPLFSMCPTGASATKERAAAWAEAVAGGRRGRRKLRWLERVRLRVWQRRFNLELGDEISEDIDNEELQEALLLVVAESTDEEVAQSRADVDRRLRATA
jgi:hypothetical protein